MAFPKNYGTGDLVTATMFLRIGNGEVQDMVSKHTAILSLLTNRGRAVKAGGGYTINFPAETELNPNVQYAPWGRQLSIERQSILNQMQFLWKNLLCVLVTEGMEDLMNMGRQRLEDLLMLRTDNVIESLSQKASEDLFGTGLEDGGDAINGLQHAISDNGLGTVGGINSSTETWWRNQVLSLPDRNEKKDPITVKRAFKKAVRMCIRNKDKCDLIVTDADTWDMLDQAMEGGGTHTDTMTAKFGFDHITCKGIPVVWDEFCPSDRAYFINSKRMKLVCHKNRNFSPVGGPRVAFDQDVTARFYGLMANLVPLNRARHLALKMA